MASTIRPGVILVYRSPSGVEIFPEMIHTVAVRDRFLKSECRFKAIFRRGDWYRFCASFAVHKILVVEDDHLSRKTVSLFLSEEGYEVYQSSDGAEALNALHSMRFDLVLADIMMPRVDGVELLVQMRRLAPETAVVLMTGYYSGDGEMIGADGFIAKPFLFKDLLYKIKQVLDRRNANPQVN